MNNADDNSEGDHPVAVIGYAWWKRSLAAGSQRPQPQAQTRCHDLQHHAGGLLGVALASVGNRLLLRMVSGGLDTIPLDVSIDIRLLLFTVAVTIATALTFGTVPAFRATRLQLTDALKAGRGPQGASGKNPLAKALVISQVALSLVLMVGAGLFLRSLVNLNNVDTGFNKANVLRLDIDSSSVGYTPGEPREVALNQQIEERLSALPNVKATSFSAFTST